VAVLNMLPLLEQQGWSTTVLFGPELPNETPDLPDELLQRVLQQRLQLVVFQKVHGPSALKLAHQLRVHGVASCFMVCDLVDNDFVRAMDGAITVTAFLRSLHDPDLHSRIHVVHDGIERPDVRKPAIDGRDRGALRPLRAVLVTSSQLTRLPVIGIPPRWLQVTIVGLYAPTRAGRLRDARWAIERAGSARARWDIVRFLACPRIRCVPWTADGVYEQLRKADIGIIPIDREPAARAGALPPDWMRKSENRLTLKMSVGLPVVATPIPSYEPVVVQGENGFLADSRQSWMDTLARLRDAWLRAAVGSRAQASVAQRFSQQEQARQLAQALQAILRDRAAC
jgi:glycosyltransferase involved in cell wall biosynthesis